MESRTFHLFPRLPKELRDMIWALASRPEQPSAHFFTVFDSSNDAEWSVLGQYSMRHWRVARCSLAAPLSYPSDDDDDDEQQLSWARGNRSAYLIDSALWMACRESRDAMERRFRVAKWDHRRWDMFQKDVEDCPDAPATAAFTCDGEWRVCLTRPQSDVFLLQPFDADTAGLDSLPFSVPIFDKDLKFSVSHVALDYDTGWLVDGDNLPPDDTWTSAGTIGCAIRAATNALYWAKNLWFVDRRIERRPGALPTTTTNRHQFHGNGCRLTEVREGDADWEIDPVRDVFRFLEELAREVGEYFEESAESVEINFADPNDAPAVGVLAYEEC